MKKIIFILLAFFIAPALQSQNLSTAPTGEAGLFGAAQGGSPMLNLVLMELRTNAKSRDLGETVGSPYSTENFVKSKIYYGDEPQGDFFIRYNALNSVIEMKKTDLPDEEAKRLYPDKKIKIKYLNKELRFTTYINKKKETKNGYLSQIASGPKYKLYHRLAVKYSEGKPAINSMVADIPSRFAHFEEYYYQKIGVDRIDFLPQKKGGFIKQFDKELRENIKIYLKEENINLDHEVDLIKAFNHINAM
jgi:hypothetical protein